jgi:chemotaxis signal transduction protein
VKQDDQTVARLRQEFDASFARAPASTELELQALLQVRVGELAVVVRLSELAAVHACPVPTPLPSASATLLGLCAVRGTLLALHDLGALLGSPRTSRHPRWLALCAADRGVGLALDEIDGYLQVAAASIHEPASSDHAALAGGRVEVEGAAFPLVRVSAVLAQITRSTSGSIT